MVLITGGAGFLGAALVRELLKVGDGAVLAPSEIRIFDTRPPRSVFDRRARYLPGDIRSPDDLDRACAGADIVLHCAAVIDWGQRPESYLHDVNVNGTRNVLRACAAAGVRAMVYTSTMDVLYDGRSLVNGDERTPYPKKYTMAYAKTKALAERVVLESNGLPLRTCAIRPCGMFGEGDPYHVSSFLRMAQSGALRFRAGSGRALFQHVYVGNVAHAHLLAGKSLLVPDGAAAGSAYIITDFPAKNFFDYMEPIISGIGYAMPPKRRSIPMPIMYALGCVCEGVSWLCRPFTRMKPVISRTSVNMVCKDLTFNGGKARRELGYRPIYTEEEAIDRTIQYFKKHGPV